MSVPLLARAQIRFGRIGPDIIRRWPCSSSRSCHQTVHPRTFRFSGPSGRMDQASVPSVAVVATQTATMAGWCAVSGTGAKRVSRKRRNRCSRPNRLAAPSPSLATAREKLVPRRRKSCLSRCVGRADTSPAVVFKRSGGTMQL